MVTQTQFKNHWKNLYNGGAIYVWGANGETITKDLVNRLYNCFHSSKYNRTYYDNKLREGQGKIGADCSGAIYPLSKSDATAKGYYQACKRKGGIASMPKDTACLIFNASFTHVGAYMGDGTTIEMMNSTRNCVKQNFQQSRWAYYGIPVWLDTEVTSLNTGAVSIGTDIMRNVQKWVNDFVDAGLTVDGRFGLKTKKGLCMALQKELNDRFGADLDIDGSFGLKTKAACVNASKSTNLTYICQAMLYAAGYDVSHSYKGNNLDGKYGANMKKTVKEYQSMNRGLRQDGECGPATFYIMFN